MKIGDKFRRTLTTCAGIAHREAGYVGEVAKDYGDGDIDDTEGNYHAKGNFELLPADPLFAVGDKVRVLDNKDNSGRDIKEYEVGATYEITKRVCGTKCDAWLLNNHYQYLHSHQIEPATLTIVAGRCYKTRDGRKVGPIFSQRSSNDYWPWELEESRDSIDDIRAAWRADGTFAVNGEPHDADIIAEWTDDVVAEATTATEFTPTDDGWSFDPAGGKPKFSVGDRVKVIKEGEGGSYHRSQGGFMSVHGTLINARMLFEGDPRCPCLRGQVFGDTKGRFRDGDYITTSRIKAQDDGCVFQTTYSVYKVGSWA